METVSVTVPENPLTPEMIIIEVPGVPVGTTTLVGVALVRKSGEPFRTLKETKTT